jgi:hypothetical protein
VFLGKDRKIGTLSQARELNEESAASIRAVDSSGFSPLLALGPWGRPPLHGLGNCLRIAESFFCPFE